MPQPELIVLVDEAGQPIGSSEKWAVHHSDTPLHLAFSCYVFDEQGLFLATRRARSKKVWPGVWSNSVCGHPAPGEPIEGAVRRRLQYELGMAVQRLEVVLPDHSYRAPPFQGVVEYEFCPVYLARATTDPRRNPVEVEAYRWVKWADFVAAAESDTTDTYSWWCKNQLKELKGHPLLAVYSRSERS